MSNQSDEPDEPLLPSIPAGSPAHKKLAEAMRTLRDNAPDAQTARLYEDILAGRRSARDLVDSPGFAQAADQGLTTYAQQVEELDEQERAELDQQARLDAESLDRPPQ